MKLTMTGKLLALGIATMAFAMTGCSGGQEDDEALEVTEEGQAEGSAEASEGAEDEAAAEAETEANAEPTEEVAQDTPAEEVPTPDTAGVTGGASLAPAGGGTTEVTRVVRYVNASVAPLLNAASASAGNVGQLVKGDRVMVVIDGGFGRIADGMFIRVDHLSAKPVARERKDAIWQAPAH